MSPKDWNATLYLKFESERTRPARDLLAQVPLQGPKRIVDLGCGPGNSTALLAARFPESHLTGLDSSADMIHKARSTLPTIDFSVQDLSTYTPQDPVDVFFSNAVFQWLPNGERLEIAQRLLQSQPSGGVFAFQVPDNLMEPLHVTMRDTARDGPWAKTLSTTARDVMQSPQEIYDGLKPLCSEVNIWHTYYYHVLADHQAVVEWVKGTGLRPFLDPLSSAEQEAFLKDYLARIEKAYPKSVDGTVLLRFPRLFVVATRE